MSPSRRTEAQGPADRSREHGGTHARLPTDGRIDGRARDAPPRRLQRRALRGSHRRPHHRAVPRPGSDARDARARRARRTPAGPRPPIATLDPELGWPLEEDHARLLAFPAQVDAAFDAGAAAGMRFLAEHSWPDGFTADAMLACRTSEPTPTYAELDADGYRLRIEFQPVATVPMFRYPPTGEYPFDSGLRSYLGRLIVVTEENGTAVSTFDDIARLAVRPDGTVVMYPTCFEFLPGQLLEHRVTDGNVGGYTDAEAEGDIRVIVTTSPAESQDAVCAYLDDGVLDAADLDDLAYMIMPPDIEYSGVSIPRRVMERTLTELCRG